MFWLVIAALSAALAQDVPRANLPETHCTEYHNGAPVLVTCDRPRRTNADTVDLMDRIRAQNAQANEIAVQPQIDRDRAERQLAEAQEDLAVQKDENRALSAREAAARKAYEELRARRDELLEEIKHMQGVNDSLLVKQQKAISDLELQIDAARKAYEELRATHN